MVRFYSALLWTLTLGAVLAVSRAGEDERPNILVILADDLGYADTGAYGSEEIKTPNIDRLAAAGIRCTDGYVTHSFCSPTRAGLVTGRYQHRFGHETNVPYDPHNLLLGLPRKERTVADRLRKLGYATGVVGKWHLGASHLHHPMRRGFGFFYGFLGGGHDYYRVDLRRPLGEGYFTPIDDNGKPTTIQEYLTTDFSRAAVRFIEQVGDRPFFLYLAYNAPHTPLQAPDELIRQYASISDGRRRVYAAMITAMDTGIGMVLEALQRTGKLENTLIFFLSDNGGPTRVTGASNKPLRGQKGELYDGGIRVPYIVAWPARLPQGGTFGMPVSSLDIAATALAVAGADLETMPELEGIDLIPYLSGSASPSQLKRALFWRQDGGRRWAVRVGRYKLIKPTAKSSLELYDLQADIGEQQNIIESEPQLAEELRALYREWNRLNIPPRWPNPPSYHPELRRFHREFQERWVERVKTAAESGP